MLKRKAEDEAAPGPAGGAAGDPRAVKAIKKEPIEVRTVVAAEAPQARPAAAPSDERGALNEEEAALHEILPKLSDVATVIPAEVTTHYLQRAGFNAIDAGTVNLVSLACQRFIQSIAMEAKAIAMKRAGPNAGGDTSEIVLKREDLAVALREHGISVGLVGAGWVPKDELNE